MLKQSQLAPSDQSNRTTAKGQDEERQVTRVSVAQIPHWKFLVSQGYVNDEILSWPYEGSGVDSDPYVVKWIDNDPRDPQRLPDWKKWTFMMVAAFTLFTVTMISSAYTGSIPQIIEDFGASNELAVAGVCLYVAGFAVGPIFWGPLSEVIGRQFIHLGAYGIFVVFNAATIGAQNIETILILRFLAGSFGAAPLTNAGGVVADIFPPQTRGFAMVLFAAGPFMGPVLGPPIGGFLGQEAGWRAVCALMAGVSAMSWLIGGLVLPETYPPVLLAKRAETLSNITGKVYRSHFEVAFGRLTLQDRCRIALVRPWKFLFGEPIVFLFSTYLSIVYATLYMLFAAFPIVFQRERGWTQGVGGLAFIGVAIGTFAAVLFNVPVNAHYRRMKAPTPESRLPPAMVGGVSVAVGLMWFAWTNGPEIHWAVSIAGSSVFGFGMVIIFVSISNYLVDAYTIYATSVLAGGTVMRSALAAAFPLFTRYMYEDLGIHWASSVPGFLGVACAPLPFIFYYFGAAIRRRSKLATWKVTG